MFPLVLQAQRDAAARHDAIPWLPRNGLEHINDATVRGNNTSTHLHCDPLEDNHVDSHLTGDPLDDGDLAGWMESLISDHDDTDALWVNNNDQPAANGNQHMPEVNVRSETSNGLWKAVEKPRHPLTGTTSVSHHTDLPANPTVDPYITGKKYLKPAPTLKLNTKAASRRKVVRLTGLASMGAAEKAPVRCNNKASSVARGSLAASTPPLIAEDIPKAPEPAHPSVPKPLKPTPRAILRWGNNNIISQNDQGPDKLAQPIRSGCDETARPVEDRHDNQCETTVHTTGGQEVECKDDEGRFQIRAPKLTAIPDGVPVRTLKRVLDPAANPLLAAFFSWQVCPILRFSISASTL